MQFIAIDQMQNVILSILGIQSHQRFLTELCIDVTIAG